MATIRRQPVSLDTLADDIAYVARYGMQQFPWLTGRLGRMHALNRALCRLVERENEPPKKKKRDADEE